MPENILPKHIAVIMDGNRRWATKQGKSADFGHRKGYENFVKFGELCRGKGIHTITVYAFSTENWKRSQEEVSVLMDLMRDAIKKETKRLNKENIRIRVIGRREDLPEDLQKAVEEGEEKTKNNTGGDLNIALSYGGRAEIVDAFKRLAKKGVSPEDITEDQVSENLYTAGQEEPDLIIRCGGVKRLSNFLLWQSNYSEMYFLDTLWPDFDEKELDKSLEFFANTKRNFGE
jgi:undecaprenyl diphosphate synthase